jgi:hypothetical protein
LVVVFVVFADLVFADCGFCRLWFCIFGLHISCLVPVFSLLFSFLFLPTKKPPGLGGSIVRLGVDFTSWLGLASRLLLFSFLPTKKTGVPYVARFSRFCGTGTPACDECGLIKSCRAQAEVTIKLDSGWMD